ncbi:hypothetical protein AB0E55_07760 [Amycolatopsis keratiniphila]|uniref:hypothetical protein n=1 Tax=Amycolatopsis keratiniphila TaxID=129921 RepID=UPI0033DC46BC
MLAPAAHARTASRTGARPFCGVGEAFLLVVDVAYRRGCGRRKQPGVRAEDPFVQLTDRWAGVGAKFLSQLPSQPVVVA